VGISLRFIQSWYATSHPNQLSFLPSVGWEINTGKNVVMLSGWEVKAGMYGHSAYAWDMWQLSLTNTLEISITKCHTNLQALLSIHFNWLIWEIGVNYLKNNYTHSVKHHAKCLIISYGVGHFAESNTNKNHGFMQCSIRVGFYSSDLPVGNLCMPAD